MRYLLTAVTIVALAATPACDKATPVAPVGTTITLSVNPTLIATDGEAEVTAIVRREDGSPVNPGTEVIFSTTLGELDPGVAETDTRGVATTTLRGNDQVGLATVSASSGAATAASVEVQIGSAASSITLQATPGSLPPEGGVIDLLAVVRGSGGQLLSDLAVTFETDLGTLDSRGGSLVTDDRGEARDRLTVTAQEISRWADISFEVSALVAADDGTLLSATAEINVSGEVASISLQATPANVPEQGGTLSLLALVLNDSGDPVQDAGVNFLTDAGRLESGGSQIRTNAAGEASDTLTVTEEDLQSVPGQSFRVRAQTVGANGTILEASITVGVGASATLTVQLAGQGTGTVTSSPSGIDCPGDCNQSYSQGTVVTLTATPDAGSTFTGWSGSCSGTNSITTVTMTADKSCTATFD